LPAKHHTVDDLLRELEERESLENPDAVVPMSALRLTADGTLAMPEFDVRDTFEFTTWSKQQLAAIVGVKWTRWFANMNPRDQASEVNTRLMAIDRVLRVRTTRALPQGSPAQGTVTALLSESYTPLPDTAVLRLLTTALREVETDLKVAYAVVTERTTSYMIGVGKPFRPGDDHEVGDIWGGIKVRNSGVGYAAFGMFAGLLRLICKNGMTAPIDGALLLKRAHRAFDVERLRDTLAKRLRDLPGKLALAGQVLTESRRRAVANPGEVFLAILRAAHLPVKLAVQIAEAYDEEPALKGTAFGVAQALTRAAQAMTAELRFELEQAAGGYLRSLPRAN
jgi:hypothetical protein